MTSAGSNKASDHQAWTEELTGACAEAAFAWQSCKQWVALQRALRVQKVQLKLLARSGLGDGLGLVAEQGPAPVEVRAVAGQLVSVLALVALELGLTIEVCTHVLYKGADFSKYLERNPQRRAQVTSLQVNNLGTSSEVVCGMTEQGNHAKTLTVTFPSTNVAALLEQEAPRELVQLAARSSPGTVIVVVSGSDNFGFLSSVAHNIENAAVWIARPGMAGGAQLPLLSFREKLANPPVTY